MPEKANAKKAAAILKELSEGENYVSPGELAILYAALGKRKQALDALEKAFAERDLQLQFLNVRSGHSTVFAVIINLKR